MDKNSNRLTSDRSAIRNTQCCSSRRKPWHPKDPETFTATPNKAGPFPRLPGRIALFGAAFAVAAAGFVHATSAQSVNGAALGLVCELNQTSTTTAADTIAIDITLINTGAVPIRLLRWNTGFGDNIGEVFHISRDGSPLPFKGPVGMRSEPVGQDYLSLQPGQRETATYDITAYYEVIQPGTYTVTYSNPVRDLGIGAAPETDQPRPFEVFMDGYLDCGGASFTVSDGSDLKTPQQEGGTEALRQPASITGELFDLAVQAAKAPAYDQCSTSEQGTVKDAHDTGYDGIRKSYRQLTDDPSSGNELYATWFGAFQASRFNTVRTNYSDMGSAAADDTFTYFCKPDRCSSPSTIAYTYKGSRKIYLCNAFWRLSPDSGFDTQAGTVVHEMSHAVTYTDDIVYGTTRAKALAASRPNEAIRNADNYEYFTEDGGF